MSKGSGGYGQSACMPGAEAAGGRAVQEDAESGQEGMGSVGRDVEHRALTIDLACTKT